MSEDLGKDKSRRLGRGLGALIGGGAASVASAPTDRLRDIPVGSILPNPFQPRREFNAEELRELENSLRASGLLQPISVRVKGDHYQLIAGERRLRAAKRLGWTSIPAVIRDIDDTQHLSLALVENLQREDLNPIEEGEGYRRLVDEFGFSQLQLAEAVGKERSTVANVMRLLNLPDEVQQLVRSGKLSAGHARALLALPSSMSLTETARQIVARDMTVRDVERLAHRSKSSHPRARGRKAELQQEAGARHVVDRLRRYLQTDVQVVTNEKSRGELRIRFYSADDLERLMELIIGTMEDGT